MMQDKDYARLCHMRDFAQQAADFAKGKNRRDLDTDQLLSLAILHLIEITGEAAKSVSQELRGRHPEIPWSSIIGARDRLAHGYMKVNFDTVWAIVKQDLALLVRQLEELLEKEF